MKKFQSKKEEQPEAESPSSLVTDEKSSLLQELDDSNDSTDITSTPPPITTAASPPASAEVDLSELQEQINKLTSDKEAMVIENTFFPYIYHTKNIKTWVGSGKCK